MSSFFFSLPVTTYLVIVEHYLAEYREKKIAHVGNRQRILRLNADNSSNLSPSVISPERIARRNAHSSKMLVVTSLELSALYYLSSTGNGYTMIYVRKPSCLRSRKIRREESITGLSDITAC